MRVLLIGSTLFFIKTNLTSNKVLEIGIIKMSRLNNSATLIGNLGKDPILNVSEVNEKLSWTKLDVATHDHYINAKKETVKQTHWHTVFAYGNNAKNICKYLKQGDKIALEGKIVTLENKVGDVTYRNTIIQLREFTMLGTSK